MSDLLFTSEHEWVLIEGDVAKVGISTHAAEELGEIVYVELPKRGSSFEASDEFGTVESVKTLSSLYMPVSGEVLAVNDLVVQNPGLLNEDTQNAWLIQIRMSRPEEVNLLMSPEGYAEYLETV